jgi:hypothetical protein
MPWAHDAKDGFHGRGLASGVRPQQTNNLSLIDLQRDIIQDLAWAVKGVNAL